MTKKFLPEIIGLLLAFLLAFLFSGKPNLSITLAPRTDVKRPAQPPLQKQEIIKINRPESSDQTLKDRNIFADDGIYLKPGEKKKPPLPENPYSLIGILDGKERKAVFRDYTGTVLVLPKGKKLIDEAVITRIDLRSVIIKRADKELVLKVFQYPDPKPLRIKNP